MTDPPSPTSTIASASASAPAAAATEHPVVLFDGVCNLCDAAVQFVIDRDRHERFRFAALQSEAARSALARAGVEGALPDSMVVIDDRGVHTRSDAALAVVRRLGFPWSLFVIGGILPKVLRDALYAWIARNRYRWFGRQTACRMPTPELRARFLDADETPAVVPDADTAETGQPTRSLGVGTLPGRFLIVYPLVFMLPFPLTLLALLNQLPVMTDSAISRGIGRLIGLHAEATQPVVGWLGRTLTGSTPSFEMTGSGDGLASYLGVLLDLCVAGGIAAAWWLWRRGHAPSARVVDIARILLRYYVASVMLSYGFAKVFPLQFAPMGPDRLLQPYGDSSPMGLLWTFMGASTGYQMFGGAAEVLGGLLLLFRRTSLLGALVVVAVMTNVFALNVFFDVPVKLYSFHYLAFAMLIAWPDLPRLVGLLVANVPVAPRDLRPFWHGSRQWTIALGIAKAMLIVALLGSNIDSRVDGMHARGRWGTPHELHGIYRVESFRLVDMEPGPTPIPDDVRWVRVGLNPPFVATVQRADGSAVRMRLRIDDAASTLALFDRSLLEPEDEPLRMERLGDGRVRLTGTFDDRDIEVTLRPSDEEPLFQTRGFRWVNEYPFNR